MPFEQGVLEPKVREFILIAVGASTAHLFPIGVRTHMREASLSRSPGYLYKEMSM